MLDYAIQIMQKILKSIGNGAAFNRPLLLPFGVGLSEILRFYVKSERQNDEWKEKTMPVFSSLITPDKFCE